MEEGMEAAEVSDLLVRDGRIIEIRKNLSARGATVIDARDRIVMPGFVDTHWHLWNTLLRPRVTGVFGASNFGNYTPMKALYGPLYRPLDSYRSVRLSLAEALACGITTVLNFNHNVVSRDHADAELRAHHEMGVRTLFGYGTPEGRGGEIVSEADVLAVRDRWFGSTSDTSVVYGLGVCPGQMLADDAAMARRNGLPIIVHGVRGLLQAGLVGPDVRVAHSYRITDADIASAGANGARFSTSATVESMLGAAYYSNAVNVQRLLGTVAVSVDSAATQTADMFNAMRAMLSSSVSAEAGGKAPFTVRELVEAVTVGGARFHGLEDEIGTLTVGKRADIQLLRTDQPTMAPFSPTDAQSVMDAVVFHGTPQIVDTVMVEGQVLLEGGELRRTSSRAIISEAQDSMSWLDLRALTSSSAG
ncbi:amidohydrolase family protein [Nocardioides cavernae]|uniref:Amidohydrolase family protein n=1 Tax=Nocardioides cavernae TaxID=1921566 RepID=A0ABR8N7Y1_9ACTN|nr:amidohydrolase family protein [Nocardioides cavernae]MBD3924258.1 amidohydrolase family protein [Nocardioides cavernae]MBM7510803.1 cytosine/adenosine deaminase-related metal-dependent hydrolase [Nocardioides cavernae]